MLFLSFPIFLKISVLVFEFAKCTFIVLGPVYNGPSLYEAFTSPSFVSIPSSLLAGNLLLLMAFSLVH